MFYLLWQWEVLIGFRNVFWEQGSAHTCIFISFISLITHCRRVSPIGIYMTMQNTNLFACGCNLYLSIVSLMNFFSKFWKHQRVRHSLAIKNLFSYRLYLLYIKSYEPWCYSDIGMSQEYSIVLHTNASCVV